MGKKNKKVASGITASIKKIPAVDPGLPPEEFMQRKPAWRFSWMKQFDEYGYGLASLKKESDTVLDNLCDLETQTWSQIKQDRKKHHFIKVEDLSPKARHMLIRTNNDIPEIFLLHMGGGKPRLFGLIQDVAGVVDLFWWDPMHELCPSHKKHTGGRF